MSANDKILIRRDASGKMIYIPYVAPAAADDKVFMARDAVGKMVACKVESPTATDSKIFTGRDAMAKTVGLWPPQGGGSLYFMATGVHGAGANPDLYSIGLVAYDFATDTYSAPAVNWAGPLNTANTLASWTGGTITGITYDESAGRLYACGSFSAIDNVTAGGCAYWDGTGWTAFSSGLPTSGTLGPKDILAANGSVYITLTRASSSGAEQWFIHNGSTWVGYDLSDITGTASDADIIFTSFALLGSVVYGIGYDPDDTYYYAISLTDGTRYQIDDIIAGVPVIFNYWPYATLDDYITGSPDFKLWVDFNDAGTTGRQAFVDGSLSWAGGEGFELTDSGGNPVIKKLVDYGDGRNTAATNFSAPAYLIPEGAKSGLWVNQYGQIESTAGDAKIWAYDDWNHVFWDASGRDSYFTSNPSELVDGVIAQLNDSGTYYTQYSTSTTSWSTIDTSALDYLGNPTWADVFVTSGIGSVPPKITMGPKF